MNLRTLLLTTSIILTASLGANAGILANYLDSSWEEQFKVTDLQSIEMWEQPRTQYTPKNLVSEQQIRYSGKNGTNSYESYTFHVTDYDTKITGTARGSDGSYYIQDNLGKYYKTGEQGLTAEQKTEINKISELSNKVTSTQNQVNNMQGQVNSLGHKINNVERRMEQGLATVTALTALHPNPRHKGKTQISVGTGMYSDNVAGAVGIFHYLTERVMLNAGAAYGGDTSWAGNVGITIGL